MAYGTELIEQFKAAYASQFGVMLTEEEAVEELRELAELVRLTAPENEEQTSETTHS